MTLSANTQNVAQIPMSLQLGLLLLVSVCMCLLLVTPGGEDN